MAEKILTFTTSFLVLTGLLLSSCRFRSQQYLWTAKNSPSHAGILQVTVTDFGAIASGTAAFSEESLSDSVDFGSRNMYAGMSPLVRINVKNISKTRMSLTQPFLQGQNSSDFLIQTRSFVSSLGPEESTSFYVGFLPKQAAPSEAKVEFFYTGVSGHKSYSFLLTGTGTDRVMYVSAREGNDANDGRSKALPKKTIQAAIDAVQSQPALLIDAVLIEDGEYVEQILLRSSLALVGRHETGTVIRMPVPMVENPAVHGQKDLLVVSGVDALSQPVNVRAELAHLTLMGPGKGECGSVLSGIHVRDGAFAYIHDSQIVDMREEPMSGCQNGVGIFVGYSRYETDVAQKLPAHALVVRNTVDAYQKAGILAGGLGTTVALLENDIHGVGKTSKLAQNGIQMVHAAGIIEGNDVSMNLCDYFDVDRSEQQNCGPDPSKHIQAGGVVVVGPEKNVLIRDNRVQSNDAGLLVVSSSELDSSKVTMLVSKNLFSGNRRVHVYTELETVLTQNVLLDSPAGWGLLLAPGIPGVGYPFVTAEGNHIASNRVGIEVLSDPNLSAGLDPLAVFSKNNLMSLGVGIKNSTSFLVDARGNYFGAVQGPSSLDGSSAVGTGTSVGINVLFQNFATTLFPIPVISQ